LDFTRLTLPEEPYLYVERECPFEGPKIAAAMGSAFAEVAAFLKAKGIAPAGPPMSVYLGMDPTALRFRGAMAVAPGEVARAEGAVRAGVLPAGEAMRVTHLGAYANLNLTHRALGSHMEAAGIPAAFPIWEKFLDDPREVAEDRLRTEIFRAIG